MTGTAKETSGPEWTLEMARSCWHAVAEHLCAEVGQTLFDRFLRPLSVAGTGPDRIVMAAPTKFMRSWIMQNFGDHLYRAWKAQFPALAAVELIVNDGQMPAPARAAAPASPRPAADPARQDDGASAPAVARDLTGLNGDLTFETFVTGASNALAYQAAKRLVESDHIFFNTLYIFGPTGVGKTHLQHAIGNAMRRRNPAAKIRYLSAENFLARFIGALRGKDTLSFKDEFRSLDLLLIDDVQFIARKEHTQEEFFHTLNSLMTDNRRVVITADGPPGALEGFHERICTRLAGGMIADVGASDAALRLEILRARAARVAQALEAMGRPPLVFEAGALELLAESVKSNVRVLDGAFNALVSEADLKGLPVSPALVQGVLKGVLRVQERTVTVDHIIQVVADYYGFKPADLRSERRAKPLVTARHAAQWLARHHTDRSTTGIGKRFGDRDHSSVIHACRKIEDLRLRDAQLKADLEALAKLITA